MKLNLTRRRFGQLAIASTAAAGFGYLANKTFAQIPNLLIYGARPVPQDGGILVQSLDLVTNLVQELTTTTLGVGEKLIGFTSLADGTLVMAMGPVRAGRRQSAPTRLFFQGTSPRTVTVSGLRRQDTLDSLLGTNDGSLYGLVIRKNGRPPATLVAINLDTGESNRIDRINLPRTDRFSNLAQCPNGTIYTTAVGREGGTSLVQLNLAQGRPTRVAQLNVNGRVWNSGLSSLICSPAGELFALAAPRYVTPNKLYSVNPSNGAMTQLIDFNVSKITTLSVLGVL